ncbi:MAG: response regulator transcription factor [Alphaproteobacteria bacterium]|nr:response regulator transcription factor [Alphaproteobacteria bacterium]MBP7758023.1 response regulator transcription factor [Alphaproteobacteria bacterium]MBP7761350.1 response regulator transcription factor [Alphaproteobacteria bacterium]MBP7904866.1 response regulator transcription factor [Alphaproteobacteria bacterium]
MVHKVTLIDDDLNITASVAMVLESEGFNVESYSDGESGLDAVTRKGTDLVVLDIKMPRMDGMEVLKKIREFSEVPVIFLTSKDDEIDQLLGLRMGADDYITKPFSQRLLLERIRVLLRRQDLKKSDGSENNHIVYGDIELDEARHLCTWKKRPVNLTVTEFLLVKSLVTRPGHVRTRDQLIDMAYGENIYVDDRTVDSHIKRIRNKFKKVDDSFDQIETLYGVGYRIKEA